jgi:hypothetical protein
MCLLNGKGQALPPLNFDGIHSAFRIFPPDMLSIMLILSQPGPQKVVVAPVLC